jgi:DNA-binding transcriptional LysR family regulator
MNIHHLELFYFVAKHGGIAAAVRNIPYGIQQPAVSGQIAKLKKSLGTKLFQRRPFALSPAGLELFEFIKPFFDNIEIVGEKLRQNRSPQLRIAAPSIVLHDYIPELLQKLRTKFPEFRLYLHEAARVEAERLLLAREVDLAITLVEKKIARRNSGSTFTRATVDSAWSQKIRAGSRWGVVEARQDRRNADQFPANGSRSRFLSARS